MISDAKIRISGDLSVLVFGAPSRCPASVLYMLVYDGDFLLSVFYDYHSKDTSFGL